MTSKNRLGSAYGGLWRRTAGLGTDLKIMVSPVRIRVPPLLKDAQIAGNRRGAGLSLDLVDDRLTTTG
jgi:hypothetical protein